MKTLALSTRLILLLLAVGMQSCQDKFLELEPLTNKMEDNSYITQADAFLALVSVYDVISHQEVLNFQPLRADIFSDDLFTAGEPPSGGMATRWQNFETSILDSRSPSSREEWKRCYQGIYRVNQYLAKEAGIQWKDQAKRKNFKAEAKLLRATFYFDLVRQFGWVPLVTGIISSTDAGNLKQSEPTVIYQYIAKDILDAMPDLMEKVEPNDYGRVSKAVAQLLMARIYQFYEGFAKKEQNATTDWSDGTKAITKDMVIAGLEEIISKGNYKLLPNYADIHSWENENNAESILEIQYSEKSGFSDFGATEYVNGNTMCQILNPRDPNGDTKITSGWSFGMLTWSLYKEFEAGDPRLNVTVYNANDSLKSYTPGYQNTGYFDNKYMGQTKYRSAKQEHNFPKNYIYMRLAEVYLILAELYLDKDMAKATSYLNTVRTRAMGSGAAKTTISLDDVYHEKRVEFAGEGLRYWDLLRRGLDYTKKMLEESYVPDPSYKETSQFANYKFNVACKGMLPIPDDEIRNANEGVLKQFIPYYN